MSTQEKDSNGTDSAPTDASQDSSSSVPAGAHRVPVVRIGASAGGLSALKRFFNQRPDGTQAAFVVVQHLAPDRESEMGELLQNHTEMKVSQVQGGQSVEPNTVYVIPPGAALEIRESTLYLSEPTGQRGQRLPTDHFLRTLAKDQGDNAVGAIFLTRDMRIKRFTQSVTSLFNLIDQDKERPFSHVSHNLEYEGFVEDAEEVLETRTIREIETKSRDGRYVLVRMLPYRTRDDQVGGVVITFIDITARREAETKIKERARQQAALARLGQMALRTNDVETLKEQILEEVTSAFDAQYCTILRLEDGALQLDRGTGWDEEKLQSATADIGQSSHFGYTLTVDEPVTVNDFSADDRFSRPKRLADHDIQSGMSVSIHGEDEPYGILAVHTEHAKEYTANDANFLHSVANLLGEFIRRTRTKQALREAKQEAVAATRAKSAFLANISHDLRTPLTALSGIAQVLQRRLDGEDAEMVGQILEGADQLESTLNAVLQFVDHGDTLTLTPEQIDVRAVVESVVNVVRKSAPDAVQIRVDGPTDEDGVPRPVAAHLDETALNRVLSNLVGNAVKFTEQGYVCVRIRETNKQVQVVVADTGEGMESAFLERAFEPFEQQAMGAGRKHSGHGLGLAIVLELVESMDGMVRVKSQPERGTVFRVELPRSIGEAGSTESEEPTNLDAADRNKARVDTDATQRTVEEREVEESEAEATPGETGTTTGSDRNRPALLLLEDNESSLFMFEQMLGEDFDVTACLTYECVVEAAKHNSFDLLLLDIHLNGNRSGIDALHAIRDLPEYGDVPAVACTAFARKEERQSFLEEGFDYYVSKPVDAEELQALLQRVVHEAS